MALRLLVEGLDWGVTETKLAEVFGAFGDLAESRVAEDWETGRSRGFGWVTFAVTSDGEAALRALDGQKLAGKTLRVMVAPEQSPRAAFRSADYGYTNTPPAERLGRDGAPFRNADFEAPGERAPRTDQRLYRSADFGYVERERAREAPAKAPEVPAHPARADVPTLDDDEAKNRARFGGWDEREPGDGGGNPFG
jgi:RNA recognition motif-containing protein